MKYVIRVLWTFLLFLFMFSSFPFRVDCRRAMGPGPPQSGSLGSSAGVGVSKVGAAASSSSSSSSSFSSSFTSASASSSSASSASSSMSESSHSSSSSSSSSLMLGASNNNNNVNLIKTCPFLENLFSPWPELYRPDITMKVWETTLVLEGIARSKSEVKPDGTFGVTFDLHRIVKGDAPLLRHRKQFRLQFLDNPNPIHPSNNNNNNVNVNLRSNLVQSSNATASSSSSHPATNLHSNRNNNNRILRQQQMQQQQQHKRNNTFSHSRNLKNNPSGRATLLPPTPSRVSKCSPPKATVKTGRKYFVFASKWENRFVAVYSPELANKKNTKLVDSVLCKECRQAPSVGATKEVVLKAKERIRIRCRLRAGNPVPALTWYKNGRLVNLDENRYRLRAKRRQSILVIRRTTEMDVGEYKCEAKNYLGSADAITRVVLRKSAPAKQPPLKSTSSPYSPIKPGTTPTTLWPVPSTPCPIDSYCLNGGSCSYYENIGELVCQCAEGYKGQRCDTKDVSSSGSMYLSYFCIFGSIHPPYPCSFHGVTYRRTTSGEGTIEIQLREIYMRLTVRGTTGCTGNLGRSIRNLKHLFSFLCIFLFKKMMLFTRSYCLWSR